MISNRPVREIYTTSPGVSARVVNTNQPLNLARAPTDVDVSPVRQLSYSPIRQVVYTPAKVGFNPIRQVAVTESKNIIYSPVSTQRHPVQEVIVQESTANHRH